MYVQVLASYTTLRKKEIESSSKFMWVSIHTVIHNTFPIYIVKIFFVSKYLILAVPLSNKMSCLQTGDKDNKNQLIHSLKYQLPGDQCWTSFITYPSSGHTAFFKRMRKWNFRVDRNSWNLWMVLINKVGTCTISRPFKQNPIRIPVLGFPRWGDFANIWEIFHD